MINTLQEKIGITLENYMFKVESGKIRELALAIGDLKDEYLNGKKILPTFPTVIDFWDGGKSTMELLSLNKKKVLHGEQEYEYLIEIKPGDLITVQSVLENAFTKASMDFFVVKREYFNEKGEKVLISRSTVIERH
ncbi:MaoC family dehydratase N-terminal domain-containing protein [Neobacillus sp. PS3-12]|uniref:FAS1-like dehydratase domain-containing protein n=1 Tax=Neobacillus sp. PS3-12 TaxID=3070677 RepID=UPI0027E0489C|nr:MaoC family dehydratase N-terminal domain-containing protein [Neobacillus sp. PS3-12]WML53433.1 MaoC family dehydratase N-terminal domain-containing protein [Neobacillus sp. PS3-12]